MNKIISLEQMSDFEVYNPILTLNEDVDFDNGFVVICTNLYCIYRRTVCNMFRVRRRFVMEK